MKYDGVNKSNALILSIAAGMGMFGILIVFLKFDIPGQYILGFSVFTVTLAMSEIRKDPLFKAMFLIASVPLALGLTIYSSMLSHSQEDISRLNNSFAFLSLAIVLFTTALSDKTSSEK